MKQNKTFAIEWGNSKIVTLITAENEEEAISIFKAGVREDYRDDPDLIVDICEV